MAKFSIYLNNHPSLVTIGDILRPLANRLGEAGLFGGCRLARMTDLRHMGHMNRHVLAAVALAVLALSGLGRPALGQNNDRVLATSAHPYWEVGVLDPNLSTECARGNFNQQQPNKIKMVFNGSIGPAILGVATNQYNLYDPKRRAQRDTSYFFFRDKTGACEVYRFAKGDEPKKQGALPMDFSPYRSVIEDSYKGWKLDESVKNRPPAAPR